MTAATPELVTPLPAIARNPFSPLATLAHRRFQLSARTPRELIVPLLTPILFALVIAPALKQALHTSAAYEAFVATGTIGLLIPLNTMFAGISVLVDRESGAQRELLAAPIPRALLVLANLIVAFAITALQIAVLLAVARARGIHFDITATGLLWFLAAGSIFTIGMYGAAETLAARVPRTEEYIGRVPAIGDRALVPRRLALPHQRPSQLPHVVCPPPPTHPRTRARPLRTPQRSVQPAQHLADARHHNDGRTQPARRRHLRGPPHNRRHPCLHADRSPLTGARDQGADHGHWCLT